MLPKKNSKYTLFYWFIFYSTLFPRNWVQFLFIASMHLNIASWLRSVGKRCWHSPSDAFKGLHTRTQHYSIIFIVPDTLESSLWLNVNLAKIIGNQISVTSNHLPLFRVNFLNDSNTIFNSSITDRVWLYFLKLT